MTKEQKIKKYFNQKKNLTLKNKEYSKDVETFFSNALEEDLTTKTLIIKNQKVKAAIYTKEKGVVAGIEEVAWFLNKNKIKVKKHRKDGDWIKKKEVLLELSGGVKDILKCERITLNVLQRMSGIATITNKLTKKIKNKALLCSTRKTHWGLLDKKSVVIGGGGTHRLGLHDFILIKDNHLEFLESKIEKKADNINKKKLFWEIEVKNKKQALWAANLEPSAIMFDNFKSKTIKKTILKIKPYFPNIIFEASGNINIDNIKKYRKSGVDIISMGGLTHSTKALDISLDIL